MIQTVTTHFPWYTNRKASERGTHRFLALYEQEVKQFSDVIQTVTAHFPWYTNRKASERGTHRFLALYEQKVLRGVHKPMSPDTYKKSYERGKSSFMTLYIHERGTARFPWYTYWISSERGTHRFSDIIQIESPPKETPAVLACYTNR